jgi:polyisoprenoid-binding protein YceI
LLISQFFSKPAETSEENCRKNPGIWAGQILSGFILFLIFTCLNLKAASGGIWQFASGSVQFTIKNAGLAVDGKLGPVEAVVNFNPSKPAEARISGRVLVQNLETGIRLRDKHLKKEAYFFAEKYPEISMKLIRMEKTGEKLRGLFSLTMKGITRDLEFPVEFSEDQKGVQLSTTFTINRLDFGVGSSSWTLADEVEVKIKMQLKKS